MFPRRKGSDFSAEIEAHIRLEADRYRERGMSEEEAQDAARRAFGNVTSSQERFYESWRWLWWEHLRQDMRLAVRLLKKTPGWTAVAALTVALGIGATAAIFSIVNVVVLRPLPFPHSDQLYSITELIGRPRSEMALGGDYFTMRENLRGKPGSGITDMAAYDTGSVNWTGVDGAEQWTAGLVAASLFPVLQTKPLYGRVFRPEEDLPEADPVVLLSYGLWLREFGGNPGIVGQKIRLNRAPATVIGVMPRSFDFPKGSELWLPIALDQATERARKGMSILNIVARADASASLPQVNAELEHLTGAVFDEYPSPYRGKGFIEGMRIFARPLQETLTGNVRPALRVFVGAVGLMLMIVCFNVANLMLTRATARRREIAVRVALGAPRRRIVSQLLTESLLVSLLGGAVGFGLAALFVRILNSTPQSGLPHVSIDFSTTTFAFLITVLCGVGFGLVPALGSLGFGVREALQKDSRGASAGSGVRRVRQALVVAQLGLSLTLLIGAGLLAKSFYRLRSTDPGFRAESVLTGRLNLLPKYTTPQGQAEFLERVLEQAQAMPGVESAAVVNGMALGDAGGSGLIRIENRPPVPKGQEPRAYEIMVSPDYFQTLRVPLLAGRMLSSRDSQDAPLAIVVNQAFARQFFPGEGPVGHRMSLTIDTPVWHEIVGVVGDIRQSGLDRPAMPTYYSCFLQQKMALFGRTGLLLRTAGDPGAMIPGLQKLAAAVDPDGPLFDVKTLQQRLDESVGSPRFYAALIGCFAFIAAILAAIGVYGVMSYLVMLRTSEIGIRMALGARSGQMLRMILREGLVLGILGGMLGIAGALGLSRYLAALLYGVGTHDAVTFFAAVALLCGAVLAACLVPGRRAAQIDPVTALRHE